ncbi:MAG: hypothetical protein HQK65_01065 [Desulfamplus sp.]|nr:hypothetical protein [Desulfamplus sp.]
MIHAAPPSRKSLFLTIGWDFKDLNNINHKFLGNEAHDRLAEIIYESQLTDQEVIYKRENEFVNHSNKPECILIDIPISIKEENTSNKLKVNSKNIEKTIKRWILNKKYLNYNFLYMAYPEQYKFLCPCRDADWGYITEEFLDSIQIYYLQDIENQWPQLWEDFIKKIKDVESLKLEIKSRKETIAEQKKDLMKTYDDVFNILQNMPWIYLTGIFKKIEKVVSDQLEPLKPEIKTHIRKWEILTNNNIEEMVKYDEFNIKLKENVIEDIKLIFFDTDKDIDDDDTSSYDITLTVASESKKNQIRKMNKKVDLCLKWMHDRSNIDDDRLIFQPEVLNHRLEKMNHLYNNLQEHRNKLIDKSIEISDIIQEFKQINDEIQEDIYKFNQETENIINKIQSEITQWKDIVPIDSVWYEYLSQVIQNFKIINTLYKENEQTSPVKDAGNNLITSIKILCDKIEKSKQHFEFQVMGRRKKDDGEDTEMFG